jgi:hypothetical protein
MCSRNQAIREVMGEFNNSFYIGIPFIPNAKLTMLNNNRKLETYWKV